MTTLRYWYAGDLYIWPLCGSNAIVFGSYFEARIVNLRSRFPRLGIALPVQKATA